MPFSTSGRSGEGTTTSTSASIVATGSVYRIWAIAPNSAYSWTTPAERMSLSSCASAFTVSDYTAAGHCTSSSSPHAFPHVHQHLIVGVETDEAQPGKFEIEDDVQGKRHGRREAHHVDPIPPTPRHGVPGEQRAGEHEHDEHGVDDAWGVCLGGDGPAGGDVDHRVERWENQHPRGLRTLSAAGGDGLAPDLRLQRRGPGQLPFRRRDVRKAPVHRKPCVDVLPELFPKGGLCVGWKHVEPKVGGADRVGFLDHEKAPRIPPRRGTRESE